MLQSLWSLYSPVIPLLCSCQAQSCPNTMYNVIWEDPQHHNRIFSQVPNLNCYDVPVTFSWGSLKGTSELLLTTFFTYVFLCCDIDLEWVLWEMVAVTWRLQGNKRFYLYNLLGKVSCPSSISKSILRRTLNTEKEHVSDLGSILVCVSFDHVSQLF